MRILCNHHRHIVLEIERGLRNVVYLELEDGLQIKTASLDAFDNGRGKDDENSGLPYNLYALKSDGITDLLPIDFARHYLNDALKINTYSGEIVELLTNIICTSGDGKEHPVVLLRCGEPEPVVGVCESKSDAIIAASNMGGEVVMLTDGEDLMAWSPEQVAALRHALDPTQPVALTKAEAGKGFSLTCEGVYKMATAKKVVKKVAVKKVEKVSKERVKRADGPVAQAKVYLDKNIDAIKSGKLSRGDAKAALVASGTKESTAGSCIAWWLREHANGVVFAKPVKEAKAKPVKEAKAKPVKEAKAKPGAPVARADARQAVRRASPAVAA